MKTIWKYQLDVDDEQSLEIPKGAQLLKIEAQHDVPCLWALVESQEETETIRLLTFGTGHNASGTSELTYLGSYQLRSGNFVGHVFRAA